MAAAPLSPARAAGPYQLRVCPGWRARARGEASCDSARMMKIASSIFLVAGGLAAAACGPGRTGSLSNRSIGAAADLDLAWDVFGDTPSVAWSPDGTKLAVTHGTRYYPSSPDPERAGIEVLDTTTGQRAFAVRAFAYHPVWIDDRHFVYGCSPYECEESGLYRVALDGERSAVVTGGTYHPIAGKDGGVFLYHGFGDAVQTASTAPADEYGWYRLDRDLQKLAFVTAGNEDAVVPGASWFPPEGTTAQCVSSAGGRSVSQRQGTIVVTQAGGKERVIDVSEWNVESEGPRGPTLEPCLSPSGDFLVYFSANPNQIHVVRLR